MARKQKETERKNEWHGIKTFSWCGYDWIARPLWGDTHPNDPLTWYDQDAWEINGDGTLVLKINDKPRTFIDDNGNETTKPWGRASIRSTMEFKYGTFEWDMRLPYGRKLWPALWLASDTSWPPEIDCMEGWSNDNPDYVKRLLFKNVHPTIHWSSDCDDKNGEHRQESKNNIWRWWLKGGTNFDHYKVVWTPDYVEIWYNNHKINRFTNKEAIRHMNMVEMHAIMSVGPQSGYTKEMYDEYVGNGIEMAVRNFKHTPMNGNNGMLKR